MISIVDLALLCHPVLAFLSISRPKMQAQQSKWQYFLLSFFSLLTIRYASTSYAQGPQESITDVCQTKDQPNPIASLYPMNATGTLNGTISVIPISLKLARELIPSQYRILEHAYLAILPGFPKDMYPAVLQALHDHEVQAFGYQIPDFSVRPPTGSMKVKLICSAHRHRVPLPRPLRRQHHILQMGTITPHVRRPRNRAQRRSRLRH
jgi:hypothetical protein